MERIYLSAWLRSNVHLEIAWYDVLVRGTQQQRLRRSYDGNQLLELPTVKHPLTD